MKRYELLERTAEIRDKSAIKPGCTVDVAFSTPGYEDDPTVLESFDSLDEAKKALASFESNIRELSGSIGRYYEVTEYMIEENEYDEDGEWCGGGDIWDFTPMTFEVISEPKNEVLATFDKLADAEHFINHEIAYNDDDLQNARIELQETKVEEKED